MHFELFFFVCVYLYELGNPTKIHPNITFSRHKPHSVELATLFSFKSTMSLGSETVESWLTHTGFAIR